MVMFEDSETLDIIIGISFTNEVNKAIIKEIFEILQSQQRPELVKGLKNLILLKTTGESGAKLVEEKSQERPDLTKEMKNLVNLVCRIFQTYLLIITELCTN